MNQAIMDERYSADQKFERTDPAKTILAGNEYENCTFIKCHFSGSDLSRARFIDCTFTECDRVNITETIFRDVQFIDCKMQGIHFESASLSSFADFTGTDLEMAILDQCDLRNSFNFSIDPDNNRIKKVKFSQNSLPGLLDKYGINSHDISLKENVMKIILTIIGLLNGGYMLLDGIFVMLKGKYIGPEKPGPWAILFEKLGIDVFRLGPLFILFGVLWLTWLWGLWTGKPWVFTFGVIIGICTLWYLPVGTILSLAAIIILLTTKMGR